MRCRVAIVRTVLALLVAFWPSLSGEAAGRTVGQCAEPSVPPLRLAWIDVRALAPFAFPFASREAAAILGDAGIATEWTLATPSTETADDEVKILIMSDAGDGARSRRTMGRTYRGTRTTWVYLSGVLWALGLPSNSRDLMAREQAEVGRALGRVVAHEIVHVLAPDLRHGRNGLMAGRLSRVLLVCSRVSLTPSEGQAVRAGLEIFDAALASAPGPRHSKQ